MRRVLFGFLVACQSWVGAAKLEVEPKEVAFGEVARVVVRGAAANGRVKVRATMQDEGGRGWTSSAVYLSDEEGVVDLSQAAPLEGSYEGVDPMGLFWSMELKSDEKDRTMFRHKGLSDISVALIAECGDGTVAKGIVTRKIAIEGVVVERVAEKGLTGTLIRPEGKGPFPTVIVLGGACGGVPPDSYIAQFASKGYAALGLAYFFAPGCPEHLHEVPVEFVQRGAQWLKEKKMYDTSSLCVVGTSMGGIYGLLAASYFPEVKGVVVFDGAGVVFQSLDTGKPLNAPASPFSFQEQPVPYLTLDVPQQTAENFRSCFFLRTFLSSFFAQSKEKREEAMVKVERINGPLLLMGTLDDQLLGSAYQLQQVYNRLVEYRFPYEKEFVVYPGAGHMIGIFGFPYFPTTSNMLELRQNRMVFCVGGNAKDTAKAQVDSWKRTFAFLKRVQKK